MLVSLSKQFEQGTLNSEFFQDLPYLNDTQLDLLLDFIEAVEKDELLVGKNKTSWQNNLGEEIPNTTFYRQHHFWHYHCGEYQGSIPECYTVRLAWNVKGLTSSAVLHYQKISEDEIFILAYSPRHIPFPRENAVFNPLVIRVQ